MGSTTAEHDVRVRVSTPENRGNAEERFAQEVLFPALISAWNQREKLTYGFSANLSLGRWPHAFVHGEGFLFISAEAVGGVERSQVEHPQSGPALARMALKRRQSGYAVTAQHPGRLLAVTWTGGQSPGFLGAVPEDLHEAVTVLGSAWAKSEPMEASLLLDWVDPQHRSAFGLAIKRAFSSGVVPGPVVDALVALRNRSSVTQEWFAQNSISTALKMAEKDAVATELAKEVLGQAAHVFPQWSEVTRPPEKPRKLPFAVESLLNLQRSAMANATAPTPQGLDDARVDRDLARKMNAVLPEARAFEVPVATLRTLHRDIERWLFTQIGLDPDAAEDENEGGKPFLWNVPHLVPPKVKLAEDVDYAPAVVQHASEVEFPEHLPFPVSWFGWDEAVRLGPIGLVWRGLPFDTTTTYMSLGILVWGSDAGPTGANVIEAGLVIRDEGTSIWFTTLRTNGRWGSAGTLFPWITNALVAIVADCRTFVLESGKRYDKPYHKAVQHAQRKLGLPMHAPRPWYRITLSDVKVIRAFLRDTERRAAVGEGERMKLVRVWSHRWDVSGHERVYVRRGKLPILPAERAKLEERGYEVWVTDQPPDEIAQLLWRRGKLLRQHGEWLAVKVKQISAYVKGPEDAPYRPAFRRIEANLDT